jgi:N-acetylneuraminate lyase
MYKFQKIKGLIAAVFTPFKGDGMINVDAIPSYAKRMKGQGLAGVFVNGSTGEGMLLSVQERKALAEKWAPFGDDNFKVIVHVGSTSVEIAKDLASHSQSIGAYAIASMAPNFFPSSDVNVIADYCRQVAASAPNIPFYYYHLPTATGTHIKVHELLEKASGMIPNLAGVKFTHTDFMDMHQCIAMENQRFDVLHGHDEILINGLVLGIQGAIGTTFNFIPGVYHAIMKAYANNDTKSALEYQMKSIRIVNIMLKYVNAIVGGKAIMNLTGIDLGSCRTPLRNLTSVELLCLKDELTNAGFFDLLIELETIEE